MINLNIYSRDHINQFVQTRPHETKFGEAIQSVSSLDELQQHKAEYVLLGIPEDIGIRANRGKPGASKTWSVFLNAFLNIQANEFNHPENMILLGEINCKAWMQKAASIPKTDENYYQKLGDLVKQIDEAVAYVVEQIVAAGKIPIVIGGGHNNAFGIIKGCSIALSKTIHVANIDAHTDLRPMDFRHSGNPFSYAIAEHYMDKYSVFGLHKNYTSQGIFEEMKANKKINYHFYEDCLHLTSLDKLVKLKSSLNFLNGEFGLELDCDVMENFNSSAVSPTGFSFKEMRTFIKILRKHHIHYLHICEAAPHEYTLIGKSLSYLVSDFIRGADEV